MRRNKFIGFAGLVLAAIAAWPRGIKRRAEGVPPPVASAAPTIGR